MKSANRMIERAYDKEHVEKSLYGNTFVVSKLYDRGAAWITVRDSIAVRGRETKPSSALRSISRSWNMQHAVLQDDRPPGYEGGGDQAGRPSAWRSKETKTTHKPSTSTSSRRGEEREADSGKHVDPTTRLHLRKLPTAGNMRNLLRSSETLRKHEALVDEWHPRAHREEASSPSSPNSLYSPATSYPSILRTRPSLREGNALIARGALKTSEETLMLRSPREEGTEEGTEEGKEEQEEQEEEEEVRSSEIQVLVPSVISKSDDKELKNSHRMKSDLRIAWGLDEQEEERKEEQEEEQGVDEQEEEEEEEEQERMKDTRAASIALRRFGQKLLKEGNFQASREILYRSTSMLREER
ncbi:hypothetical protein GUITHDRAFT_105643 [Guillardia theta CCMP2712]|uniref:Uncharacterized protein n=1 Tax=Guillardia theta (strain CCMP2712) TaxID=905079 RepID=L1JJK4_GUITC|nr:hypothetical protein GUITHDRAFT_105643 [Guillardia theta CCMP2712]EKX48497.1 hypothetical protein GUITHDRAFT_105643 [Guillardia theta CCMP2712]|eukprot:XP_005835477.1 hypothetical protein GUITHDRAFT_105643 [Guillardia theta CCMP2712]